MKKSSIAAAAVFFLCLHAFAATDADVKKNFRLAESGDAAGQFKMGMAYDSGTGVEKDLAKALDWYRKCSITRPMLPAVVAG